MKKFTSILSIMALSAVFTTSALAQQSANVTTDPSTTTIVAPITISNTTALTFGSFAISSTAKGTLTIGTDGGRTEGGGVTLTGDNDLGSAADFIVGGETDYSYAITMPTDLTLTTAEGATDSVKTMTVSSFVNSFGAATEGIVTSTLTGIAADDTFTIGGTLTVAANQAVGAYTSESGLAVAVNYN
jgi:hypothetical protein